VLASVVRLAGGDGGVSAREAPVYAMERMEGVAAAGIAAAGVVA
jgi:hypothetical protein